MDEYSVELRIYGSDLNPFDITSHLELEPSLVRQRGEKKGENTCWEEGMWAYNGFPDSLGAKNWASLEEGLIFTLERLQPIKSKLVEYQKIFKVILWCGHFQSELNSSFSLSPGTLQMLGDLGVELYLDNYQSAE